jgi:predicted ArsR family transcriptional regulator
VELTDPRALRAYAHPIRLKLVGLLRRSGPLTATQAGEKIGESAASCSFHLRQLAKYGLVEEAGGGKGRERPWRATAISTEWAAGGPDPATAEAGAMLSRVVVEHYFQQAIEWLDRRGGESAEWAEKAVVADHAVYLTADELAEIGEKARALLDPYLERNEDPAARPDGARPITYIQLGFPLDEE